MKTNKTRYIFSKFGKIQWTWLKSKPVKLIQDPILFCKTWKNRYTQSMQLKLGNPFNTLTVYISIKLNRIHENPGKNKS